MGICRKISAVAGPVCPRRVSTSCPQGIPPTPGGGGAGSQDDLGERPLPVALLPNHLCQQRSSVPCERCRLKRPDTKKRGDFEALGSVIHLPTATAAIRENPDPGRSSGGKRFSDTVRGIAPTGVEKTRGDNRRHPLLHRGIGNARFSQVSMHQ